MKMSFRSAGVLVAIVAAMLSSKAGVNTRLYEVLDAQSPPEPKPAFAGQTDAPAPAKPSPPVAVQTVATGLTGAWAIAILPNGSLLVTQNSGTMRVVRPDNGSVSAPLAGVPPVKSRRRKDSTTSCSIPTSPKTAFSTSHISLQPRGEAAASWPITHFYEDVWTKPFAERRTMDLGHRACGTGEVERGQQHAHRR
jgi:glucose/arabinose dehydrogenase